MANYVYIYVLSKSSTNEVQCPQLHTLQMVLARSIYIAQLLRESTSGSKDIRRQYFYIFHTLENTVKYVF